MEKRERAVLELRRHGLVPPVPTMDYSSGSRYIRSTSPVRSRSRSPTRYRSRSPELSYLSTSRRRSSDRSGYSLDDPDTTAKSYNADLL